MSGGRRLPATPTGAGNPRWPVRLLYLATLAAIGLLAAALFLDLRPARECRGNPGESDFLDNPSAYVCDVTAYEMAVFTAAALLVVASVVATLGALLRRLLR